MSVGDLMREEARTEAEQVLQRLAAEVNELTGSLPVLYVREGDRREELMALLDAEPNISVLVLGASTGKRGPGHLVAAITGKFLGWLHKSEESRFGQDCFSQCTSRCPPCN